MKSFNLKNSSKLKHFRNAKLKKSINYKRMRILQVFHTCKNFIDDTLLYSTCDPLARYRSNSPRIFKKIFYLVSFIGTPIRLKLCLWRNVWFDQNQLQQIYQQKLTTQISLSSQINQKAKLKVCNSFCLSSPQLYENRVYEALL